MKKINDDTFILSAAEYAAVIGENKRLRSMLKRASAAASKLASSLDDFGGGKAPQKEAGDESSSEAGERFPTSSDDAMGSQEGLAPLALGEPPTEAV